MKHFLAYSAGCFLVVAVLQMAIAILVAVAATPRYGINVPAVVGLFYITLAVLGRRFRS